MFVLFSSFCGQPLLAGALAVAAAWPAAGSAHAFLQLFARAADAAFSSLLLFGVLDPADELVACQGGDVLPGFERGAAGQEAFAQVGR